MPLKAGLIFFLTMAFHLNSQAIEAPTHENHLQMQTQKKWNRARFEIGLQAVALQIPSTSFQGIEIDVGYRYSINDKWLLEPHLGHAFGSAQDSSSLYTSLGFNFEWAIDGYHTWGSTDYTTNGFVAARFSKPRSEFWSVAFGFEELFLNGSQSVYAAPGFSLGIVKNISFQQKFYSFHLKTGQYQSNGQAVSTYSLGFSASLDL